ncbi:MAG: lipoate--protein ligase family protein [Chitinivibrionales bacterium]
MMISLRTIIDTVRNPAFNMAADLFLLKSCVNHSTIFVRFYQWFPASITIGLMQDASAILDFHAMKKNNVEWIRRPTGGRAVLHDNDITYSCIFPATIVEMGKTIMETYRIISRCLMGGLNDVGIQCVSCDSTNALRETKREMKLPCFLAPNRNEIMVDGKKLVGSAQKRTAEAILQHGSIPLTSAYRNLPDYLKLSKAQRNRQMKLLDEKSICISEISHNRSATEIVSALNSGFHMCLPFEAEEIPWSEEDLHQIHSIAESKEFKRQFAGIFY